MLRTLKLVHPLNESTINQGLWVISSDKCTIDDCGSKVGYNSWASNTSVIDGGGMEGLIDGPSNFRGVLVKDTVILDHRSMADVRFGKMTDFYPDAFYPGTNVSGQLGLGFSPHSSADNIIDTLFNSSVIDGRIIGIRLLKMPRNTFRQEADLDGLILIGQSGYEHSVIDGSGWVKGVKIEAVNPRIANDVFVPIESIKIGSKRVECAGDCIGSIDISSLTIRVPETMLWSIATTLGFIPWQGKVITLIVTGLRICRTLTSRSDQ